MPNRFQIETRRLWLRPVTPKEIDALHRLWTAPAVRRYLWDDQAIPKKQTAEIVTASQRLFRQHGYGLWGAWPPQRDTLLGFAGYWFFRDPPERELLIGLAAEHWGKGLAPEAGRALIRFAFDELGFSEVRASTDVPNRAAVRVMEKLGMHLERRAVVGGLDTIFYQMRKSKRTYKAVTRTACVKIEKKIGVSSLR